MLHKPYTREWKRKWKLLCYLEFIVRTDKENGSILYRLGFRVQIGHSAPVLGELWALGFRLKNTGFLDVAGSVFRLQVWDFQDWSSGA